MTAPRVVPDPWTAAEDAICELAAHHHADPLDFAARLFIASTILAAGVLGAALTSLLLRWRGWLQDVQQ